MAVIRDSSNISVSDGTATVHGWVQDVRNLGGISFLTLRDRHGTLQVTMPKKKIDPELFETLTKLPRESVVSITGDVKESNQTALGLELIPTSAEVIGEAAVPLPMGVIDKVNVEMDTRLNHRFMDLRKPEVKAIFEEIYNDPEQFPIHALGGARYSDTLAAAPVKLVRIRVDKALRKANRIHERFNLLVKLGGASVSNYAVQQKRLRNDLAHAHTRIERRIWILKNYLHLLPQIFYLFRAIVEYVFAFEINRTGSRFVQEQYRPSERRFAAAGLSDDS